MARRCLADQRGGSSTEYLVVVCLVAVAAVGTWRAFGEHIACRMARMDAQFAELLTDDRDGELAGQCARLEDAPGSSFSTAAPSTNANDFVISSPDSVASGGRLASTAASLSRLEPERSRVVETRTNSRQRATGTGSESLLDRRVGTAGKATAVAVGTIAGAALAAGGSWASTALVAACGPAAPWCAGAIAGVAAYQSVKYIANGGLRELVRSFSGVFSSKQSTIREALQVGTTLGGALYGVGASGGLGSRIATETQEIAVGGARTGTALRGRLSGALGSETPGTAASPAVAGAVCFRAGTLVHTAKGPEPIELVAPGAWVWARGETHPKASLRRVVGRFETTDQPVLALSLIDERGASDTLEVTPEHPFYSASGAWTPARSLAPGDRVRSMSGELTVTALRAGKERVTVYNLEVEVAHTYFVGTQAAWVHNKCQAPNAPRARSVRHGPLNPGPLPPEIANTFRGGSYTANRLSEPTTLYRVYGGNARRMGGYWTRTEPSGPLQSIIDSALRPEWGNTATNVASIRVPAGTTIYEGFAAPQGSLVGGGSQVVVPKVDPAWLVPVGGRNGLPTLR